MNFNRDFAAKTYDIISKMDDDSATMFARCVAFDVLVEDISKNRRAIDRAVAEIHYEIAGEVFKALAGRDDVESKTAVALVEVVSKGWDTNYENKYHRRQPRDRSGRWSIGINLSREKVRTKGGEGFIRPITITRPGKPEFNLTDAMDRAGQETSAFQRKWNERANEESSLAPLYSRVGAGGRVLRQTGEATGSKKLALAGQAGEWFGQYGPEAEKVVGPHMRRTAYRYRGTERTPDRKLLELNRNTVTAIARQAGVTQTEDFTTTMQHEAAQRAAIQYFLGDPSSDYKGRLASKQLADLQRKSGKIPPSEGIIINADGKVITQAVGYMDDHYLPFNLKNLKGLQGGQYVRSRSSGGLTTEDIYTGLISGARSVTVVSRSGIFTVDFEDDFRGGRRFNDKAAGMVNRYAKTLDAVKSRQAQRKAMSSEEKLRIREEVEEEMFGFKPAEVEAEVKRRTEEAQTRPTITSAEMDDINRRAAEAAAQGGQGPRVQSFGPKEWERIANDPKKRLLAYRADMIDQLMAEKEATKFQLDGEGYAAALDALQEQYPYYIADVRYIHSKQPQATALGLSPETDKGYVKPRFNRPEGALEGYYDTSITGGGKVSADKTNYQNLRGRLKEVKPEEAAEGAAEAKKPVTAGGLKNQVERSKKQVKVNEELKQIVTEAKGVLDPADLAEYKTLALAASSESDLDKILNTSAQRQTLIDEVDRLVKQMGNEKNSEPIKDTGRRIAQRRKTMDSLAVSLGNEEWNSDKYTGGASPAQPYLFKGAEYEDGQPAEVYQHAWKQLNDHVNSTMKGITLNPGSDLKGASTRMGRLFALSKESLGRDMDQSEVIPAVVAALPDASDEQVAMIANQIVRTPGASMQRFGRTVELIERARRIEAVAGEKLSQSAATTTIAGTAREVTRTPATSKSVQLGELAADIGQRANDVDHDPDLRGAYRKIHRGILRNEEQELFDGLADLSELDSTESNLIEAQLRKLGAFPTEFDDD